MCILQDQQQILKQQTWTSSQNQQQYIKTSQAATNTTGSATDFIITPIKTGVKAMRFTFRSRGHGFELCHRHILCVLLIKQPK